MKNLGQVKYTFFSSEDDLGSRLDNFLSKNLLNLSRSKIQFLISSGFVFFDNQQIVKNSHKISSILEKYSIFEENQEILAEKTQKKNEIRLNLSKKYDFQKMIYGFCDENLLVINKPAGLLSQSKPGEKNDETSVSELAKNYILSNPLYQQENKFQEFSWEEGREFLVHRIDKETSGLMIIPKTMQSYNFLKKEFQARKVTKKYKGIVWGVPTPGIHRLENEIRRDHLRRTKMIIVTNKKILKQNNNQIENHDEESGDYLRSQKTKIAITNYRVEKILFGGAMSLLEFEIETGRTHQIRLQMSFFGHPVVFDNLYEGGLNSFSYMIFKNNEKQISEKILANLKDLEKKRHLLHSHSISFAHPKTNKYIEIDMGDDYSEEINLILKMNNDFIFEENF